VLVQIILFDGFDPMDVVAPYEVLSAGGDISGGQLQAELVSFEGARRVNSGIRGLSLDAVGPIDLERADLFVVPGAAASNTADIPGLLAAAAQSGLAEVIGAAMQRPNITVTTVCGGSLVLAMAGLLEGRHAISHHAGLDLLEATGVQVVRARVVDDGDLVTAGGVTSGLDLGLYVVERELGPRVALMVEKLFEYEKRGTVWRAVGVDAVAVAVAP
jgi:transcriptional regulator GlxA family with amidase domain